jgi:dCMP deaminase
MTFDEYFYKICNVVAEKSNCLYLKIGSILVRDNVIISTGYNGPPRGIPHCKNVHNTTTCPLILNKKFHLCPGAHSEINAIIHAARLGIKIKDSILYTNNKIPCGNCLMMIINSGIKEVVCIELEQLDHKSGFFLSSCDLKVRSYNF